MEMIAVAIIAAAVFGICFLVDKGFTKLFRNQQQHHSGTAVRLSKRYGSIGLIVAVLGLSSLFAAPSQGVILWIAGPILLLGGSFLVAWYMSFGVFYDGDAFLVTNLFKKPRRYTYDQIKAQQLYTASGNILIELYLTDGKTVQLQSNMAGMYAFMDFAFHRWLDITGRFKSDCDFYAPDQSCWFPPIDSVED